jgi:uncharacterized membrane protein YdjX (TVP38/TMEM64 family)
MGLVIGTFIWITAGQDPEALLMEQLAMGEGQVLLMVLLISALTLLSCLAGLPVLYLGMALGFLLPFAPALLICLLVNLLSVMATFYLVRFAFKDYFQEKFGKKKLIRRINRRIARYGLWTVVFSRGIYILPTNVINFSFPLSRISARSYLLGTLLGLVPECLINVLTGYLLKHEIALLSQEGPLSWQAWAIGIFILLVTLSFILLRLRLRRKKLHRLKAVPYNG